MSLCGSSEVLSFSVMSDVESDIHTGDTDKDADSDSDGPLLPPLDLPDKMTEYFGVEKFVSELQDTVVSTTRRIKTMQLLVDRLMRSYPNSRPGSLNPVEQFALKSAKRRWDKEKEELMTKVTQSEQMIGELTIVKAHSEKENDQLATTVKQVENEKADLEKRLIQLGNEKDEFVTRMTEIQESMKTEISQLKENLAHRNDAIKKLENDQRQVMQTLEGAKRENQQRVDSLTLSLQECKKNHELHLRQVYTDLAIRMKRPIPTHLTSSDQMQSWICGDVDAMIRDLDARTNDQSQMQRQLSELRSKMKKLEDEKLNLEGQLGSARSTCAELEQYRGQYSRQCAINDDLTQKHAQTQKRLEESERNCEKMKADLLQAEREAKEAQLFSETQQNKLRKENERIHQKFEEELSAKKANIAHLEESLRQARDEHEIERDRLSETIVKMRLRSTGEAAPGPGPGRAPEPGPGTGRAPEPGPGTGPAHGHAHEPNPVPAVEAGELSPDLRAFIAKSRKA